MGMSRNSVRGLFGMNHSEMMIPHHQQAVEISNLAIATSKDAELISLATSIRDGQSAEIIQMKSWLTSGHADIDMGHSMVDPYREAL